MKLGVLQFFSWPERRVDLATVYARALERIEIMDRTGYDAVWLAEHHFSSFSVCPSVHMVGTLAAARTQRLRIGTAVSLAPFYHPLRLAEEVALCRPAVRRPGQLGRRPRLRARRIHRLWRAARGERVAVPRDGRDRIAGVDRRAAQLHRPAFPLRGPRDIAKAGAIAASAGVDGGKLGGGDRMGRGPGFLDPDGPALFGSRDRPASGGSMPRNSPPAGSPRPAATSPSRGWSRSPTMPARPWRSRAAAPNGFSVPISARSTGRSCRAHLRRPASTRSSATSTR